jgi:hypothetical protein
MPSWPPLSRQRQRTDARCRTRSRGARGRQGVRHRKPTFVSNTLKRVETLPDIGGRPAPYHERKRGAATARNRRRFSN